MFSLVKSVSSFCSLRFVLLPGYSSVSCSSGVSGVRLSGLSRFEPNCAVVLMLISSYRQAVMIKQLH